MTHTFRTSIVFLILLVSSMCKAEVVLQDTAVNPPLFTSSYNDTFYNSVYAAAVGIAQPYLLQQGYHTMTGVTVNGLNLIYNGNTYPITEEYFNPGTGYYISDTAYATYGISNFTKIWPTRCPNAFYNTSSKTFSSKIDCVGFGTRVLSAVTGTSSTNNPYLNLINRVASNNVTPFASKDFVATAYQFGVAFPTLKTSPVPGWSYVAGNICTSSVIDGYNHVITPSLGTYDGVRKGGFALCKAGDIMAFSYDSSASSNGHWMVIESTPTLLDATTLKTYYPKETTAKLNAFVNAHKVYAVPVIDDSGEKAHFNDSRSSYSGIGHGTVLIVADTADDAPTGFIFAPSTNISYSAIDTSYCYAISVGRFTTSAQLPVTIESFAASIQNKTIELNWATATEQNTNHFTIERSTDGKTFASIGTVNAKGSGNNTYDFTDYSPANGINYYRLQSVDEDGAVAYSKVVSVQFTVNSNNLSAYPNPSRNVVTVVGNHILSLELLDNRGHVITLQTLKDATNPSLSLSSVPSGIYHIRVQTTDGKTSSLSVVKE